MTRHAAGRAELSYAADQNDGQAGIKGAAPAAQGGIGGGAQSDGTGMKVLIGGEKSFRKAVPAVTKFVDFVRTEGVRVGQRDQLHARRRECIETGQLSAGRG